MANNSMLFTGGIGDFITVESFLNDDERNSLESIFYATRAHRTIKELVSMLPNFPNLKNHIVLWEDFSRFFAFHNKEEVMMNLARKNTSSLTSAAEKAKVNRWRQLLARVDDMSIAKVFPQVTRNRPYSGSSFLKFKLTDVNRFALPGNIRFLENAQNASRIDAMGSMQQPMNYYVICPYSPNDRRNKHRDFIPHDWDVTINILKTRKVFGVVLNIGEDPIPEDPFIINLSNQTNFAESIEITKGAKGYIGIDSSISVLAPKLFDPNDILIKSNNSHCYKNQHVYYAPQKKFPFLTRKLLPQ